jgi:excisionase family DNA binding protein
MHRIATEIAESTDATAPLDEPLAYSVPQAAKLIGLSTRRTWDRVWDGELASYMDGGRRLVSRAAIEAYVAAKESASEGQAA